MSGQLFGYGSLPKASPEQLPLLLPGVRNCVRNLMQVQAGEHFLIIAENTVDPVVVRAFEVVASEAGADVSSLLCKPFSPAGIDPDNPSDIVVQAYAAADSAVIMSWYPDIHSKKLPAHASALYGVKSVSMYQLATFDVLTSPAARFPLPVMFEIMRHMRLMTQNAQIRITNDLGTDLLVKAPALDQLFGGIGGLGAHGGLECLKPLTKGVRAHFPPSTIGFVPVEADGVFVPDETVLTGTPSTPIRVTVEGGYITNIEGGPEAEALSAFINGPGVSPGPKQLVEVMWGLNPKARLSGANSTLVERERRAGTLHLGIATYNWDLKAGWMTHVDCYLERPRMWINGDLFAEEGRFYPLEIPEVRTLAKEFGDPDEILRPGQPMDLITC